MSYDTCLAIRQYKDEAEKEAVHKEAFLKMVLCQEKGLLK